MLISLIIVWYARGAEAILLNTDQINLLFRESPIHQNDVR